jgi:putative ABC transport system permease protein
MKIFSTVAILILLLALINYMSLATARATIRSKEIGVRKVLGANRGKIIKQFYVESALYTLLAFLFGFLLFVALEPWFYNMMQLKIDNSFLSGSFAVSIFIGLLLLTIIIAGSYPSLILSAFNPVKVLYGKFSRQRSGASVRKFFTVLQFTVSIALIISSIIINRQLYFFRHVDTGVNKENTVMIPYPEQVSNHYSAFRREVENIRGINGTAIDQNYMYGAQDITIARSRGSKASFPMTVMTVDNSFIELLGLQWKVPPADKQIMARNGNVVINEAALKKLNLPADPVGQQVSIGDTMVVAGVLKDFNFISLHHKIEPLCLFVRNETDSLWRSDMGGCLFAKIDPGVNIPTVLESIKKVYGNFTTTPFVYNFMDEAFDAQYKAEDRLSKIFSALTVLTILIACMGLFGLAAFSAAQRTKEIGIRKVLGANVSSIVAMISGSFIKLVLVSVVIATPVAWFFMSKWLQDFAYRINIGWWVFILAGIIAVVIAFATVGFQALKAAIANPVKSLRTE